MSETYQIELLGFSDSSRDDAARAISAAFGLELVQALAYVDNAPVTVRSGIEGDAARQVAKELLGLGADVRVTSESTGQTSEYRVTAIRAAVAHREAGQRSATAAPAGAPAKTAKIPHPPDPAVELTALVCPACSNRQTADECCNRCGYTFPRRRTTGEYSPVVADEQPDNGEDIDVFETLRSSSENKALRALKAETSQSARRSTRRRRRVVPKPEQHGRRRMFVYVTVAVLVVATALLMVLSPGPTVVDSTVPDGAIQAPTGFTFRRE